MSQHALAEMKFALLYIQHYKIHLSYDVYPKLIHHHIFKYVRRKSRYNCKHQVSSKCSYVVSFTRRPLFLI